MFSYSKHARGVVLAAALLALFAGAGLAQQPIAPTTFSFAVEVDLDAEAYQVTLQQKAVDSDSRRIWPRAVTVNCDAAGTVRFVRNGTAPSGSATAPYSETEHVSQAATALLYLDSDSTAGEGSTTRGPWNFPTSLPVTFDLSEWTIGPEDAGSNITVKIDSMTGNCRVYGSFWEL